MEYYRFHPAHITRLHVLKNFQALCLHISIYVLIDIVIGSFIYNTIGAKQSKKDGLLDLVGIRGAEHLGLIKVF